jgi:hypothetical protein
MINICINTFILRSLSDGSNPLEGARAFLWGVVNFSSFLRTPFLSFRCRISWFAAEWASGSVRVADPLISGSNSTD